MQRKVVFTLFVGMFGCWSNASHYVDPEEIIVGTKHLNVTDFYVTARGSWRQAGFNDVKLDPYVPVLNTVEISCKKTDGICREIRANLRLPYILDKDDWDYAKPILSVHESEFEILAWQDGVIKAQLLLPVQDRDLEISFADESVEMRIAETRARGSDTADPRIREEYVLDDGMRFRNLKSSEMR